MNRIMALTAMLLISTPALAALASPYQRAAEINAVIEAALPVFGIRTIEQITFTGPDEYEVRSVSCVLTVNIVDVEKEGEPIIVGPKQFEAVAGELACES